jgi:hypothetical protein
VNPGAPNDADKCRFKVQPSPNPTVGD